MRYRTSYTEDRTFKYVEICFLLWFFFFFFFVFIHHVLLGSGTFSGSILRQFDWCFVLLLFTLQITKSNIKYLLQIIFSKG